MLPVYQEELVDETDREVQDKNTDSFGEILDEYLYQRPKRGEILEGEIEVIDDDTIILDVGLKRDAIVSGREMNNLTDEDIDKLSIGDVIPIQVIQTPIGDQDLMVSINDAMSYQSWQKAKDFLDDNQLLDLEVIGSNRGGILVAFEKLEGFVPNSHLPELRRIQDPERVRQYKQNIEGQQIKVKALEVNLKKGRLVFSALAAVKSERSKRLKELDVGDVITGKVVSLVKYGLFVDLGGIDGLVHISELDTKYVHDPSKIANAGDEMNVQVIGIDMERERVQLSRKVLLPDPWEEIVTRYVPGSLVEVKITNVVDFGAFAKLPEGVHGLIHKTELGYNAPGSDDVVVESGMKVLTKVLRVNAERKRISLSMRRTPMEKQLDWMINAYDDGIKDEAAEQ